MFIEKIVKCVVAAFGCAVYGFAISVCLGRLQMNTQMKCLRPVIEMITQIKIKYEKNGQTVKLTSRWELTRLGTNFAGRRGCDQ